jgi:hypothetical protein
MPTNPVAQTTQSPIVFDQILEPIADFVNRQNTQLTKHHNEKLVYAQFFRVLIYFFVSGSGALKLFINTRLNHGLLSDTLGLYPIPYSTFMEGFTRFSPHLFRDVFQYLLKNLPFKAVPDFAALGILCCVDGSLFPVINSMLWAEYTRHHQALKLHLCFELNRMIPVDFQVGSGNSSERDALLSMATAGVTYIADRGYMSFKLCYELLQKEAFFIFRAKENLIYTTIKDLPVDLPDSVSNVFAQVSDELMGYANDPHQKTYRLVRFSVNHELYLLLTNRLDLTTFQVIMLYAYRWQIELLFRFLKRTMNGIHLVRHDATGVTIQFYAMLIVALLQLHLKQRVLDLDDVADHTDTLSAEKEDISMPQESPADSPLSAVESRPHDREKPDTPSDNDTLPELKNKPCASSRLGGEADFFAILGKAVKTYWKIGIHWLTALRDLLASPFDNRVIEILRNTT